MQLNVPIESARNRLVGVQTNANLLVDKTNELGKAICDVQKEFTSKNTHLADLYDESRSNTQSIYSNIELFWGLTQVVDSFLDRAENISERVDEGRQNAKDKAIKSTYASSGDRIQYVKSIRANKSYSSYGSSDGYIGK